MRLAQRQYITVPGPSRPGTVLLRAVPTGRTGMPQSLRQGVRSLRERQPEVSHLIAHFALPAGIGNSDGAVPDRPSKYGPASGGARPKDTRCPGGLFDRAAE